jgi:hypothetical protein
MNIHAISSMPFNLLQPAEHTHQAKLHAASVSQPPSDSPDISPAAQFLSMLQKIQQTNPAMFQQIVSQITTKLQTAAKNAAIHGDPSRADQLNQLASQFQTAAGNGQLPSVQTLQEAGLAGHHGHHHGVHHTGQSSQTNPFSAFQ